MTVCRTLVVFALLFGGVGGGVDAARADEVPYRHFTTFDGLPHESITALAQTPSGLLWIGTSNGLAVYDGAEFRTIPLPDSIQAGSVKDLHPRPDGSVWLGVGSEAAVKVSPRGVTQVVELERSGLTLSRVLMRRDTVYFVTTRAVWSLPPDADQPTRQPLRYEIRPPSEANGAPPHVGVGAWDAALGPDGNIWILDGRRGPGRLRSDGSVAFAGGAVMNQGRFWNEIRFAEDGNGFIVQGGRLHRFRPAAQTLDVVTDTLHNSGTRLDLQNETVYLHQKRRVLRYDVATGQMRDPLGPNVGLPDLSPSCVLRGAEGALWIGTERGLMHLVAPGARHVGAVDGRPLKWMTRFLERDGDLWVASWGSGLLQIRPERRRATPGGYTRWVPLRARDGGLHAIPASEEVWYQWRPQAGWRRHKSVSDAVRGFVDANGTGIFWHDDGGFRHSPTPGGAPTQLFGWPVEKRGTHMLALAPNGDPILRDGEHLLRLHPVQGAVQDTLGSFPDYADATGIHMVVDPGGRVWGAFESGGLLRVAPKNDETRVLLADEAVRNVRAAGDSLILASTQKGLYLLDARNGTVRRHLTRADGLLSSTTSGAYLTPDTLYVSHPNGLTLLPADQLFRRFSSPPSLLTQMEVNLNDRALAGDSVLAASERTVGFSYTAPALTHPGRVRYEARLRPRDEEWHATARDFTRYTDLDPDTYQFEVRARLGDAPPGPTATHSFTIPPHFYETWWFQLLEVLGIIGVIVGAWRWRIYRLRQRQEELETAVETRTEELRERTEELAAEKQKTEKQAERLAELDEAKNRFFAHISHEFRTPLSLILTPLEEALHNAATNTITFGTEQVERMVRNGRRLQRLIEQLLDLATLEAGRMDLDRQLGDLHRYVRRSAEAFASMADRNGIDLQVRTAGDRLQARFDPDKVESIVNNLLSNALKFTPSGGRVTVWIGERTTPRTAGDGAAREAIIKVADTGPGMGAETQDRIFERFEHVDASDTREHEGAGLGLALTKELVELHGGTIEVESGPGEGTTFAVALPLVPAAEAKGEGERGDGAPEREGMEARGDGQGDALPAAPRTAQGDSPERRGGEASGDEAADGETATVLVVEDNAEMRAYLREQLSAQWDIWEAADGEAAWQGLQEDAPDLVLSDVMMPGIDGFELCEQIKDDPALRDVPVILLTARAETEDAIEGLDCGADDYLSKPFDVTELRRRIDNHLAARQHLREQYRQEVRLAPVDAVVDEQYVPFLETVTEVVEAHLGNPDFSVDRLAEAAALSRRQLTRRMKDAVGQTPAAFVRARRLERAQELLTGGSETVAEVAYAVGFRSPSAFSKAFREHVGHPPSEHADRQDG